MVDSLGEVEISFTSVKGDGNGQFAKTRACSHLRESSVVSRRRIVSEVATPQKECRTNVWNAGFTVWMNKGMWFVDIDVDVQIVAPESKLLPIIVYHHQVQFSTRKTWSSRHLDILEPNVLMHPRLPSPFLTRSQSQSQSLIKSSLGWPGTCK